MRIYDEPDTWLFGGVFEIVGRDPDSYRVELIGCRRRFIGRLKLRLGHSRPIRARLATYWDRLEVSEILPVPYDEMLHRVETEPIA